MNLIRAPVFEYLCNRLAKSKDTIEIWERRLHGRVELKSNGFRPNAPLE